MFPEVSDRDAISYLEGEKVPKSRCIMIEGIGKMFVICVLCTQRLGCEGT